MAPLTAADRQLLLEIMETNDPAQLAARLHTYYADLDRADRTPRPQLYLHLGLLTGAVMRVLALARERQA